VDGAPGCSGSQMPCLGCHGCWAGGLLLHGRSRCVKSVSATLEPPEETTFRTCRHVLRGREANVGVPGLAVRKRTSTPVSPEAGLWILVCVLSFVKSILAGSELAPASRWLAILLARMSAAAEPGDDGECRWSLSGPGSTTRYPGAGGFNAQNASERWLDRRIFQNWPEKAS